MRAFFERFFICLLIFCLCGPARADNLIRVAVYGDSLTSGYQLQPEQAFPARLDRKFKEVGFTNVEVLNMSVTGETSGGGVERLSALQMLHPDVVVLELGANDVLRGVNPNVIYTNLAKIISALMAENVYVVLVGIKAPPAMGERYSVQLSRVYQQLADVYHISLYPFALEGVAGREDLNLADNYHPNAKGVDVMMEHIYPLVDAGVRWRIQMIQYQQDLQQGMPISPPSAR